MYGDLLNTIGFVETADPEVGEAMELELKRQRRNLELIASENIVSPAVMAAMGTVGLPGSPLLRRLCRCRHCGKHCP